MIAQNVVLVDLKQELYYNVPFDKCDSEIYKIDSQIIDLIRELESSKNKANYVKNKKTLTALKNGSMNLDMDTHSLK
jgi:hypothetical protein